MVVFDVVTIFLIFSDRLRVLIGEVFIFLMLFVVCLVAYCFMNKAPRLRARIEVLVVRAENYFKIKMTKVKID